MRKELLQAGKMNIHVTQWENFDWNNLEDRWYTYKGEFVKQNASGTIGIDFNWLHFRKLCQKRMSAEKTAWFEWRNERE